MNKLKRRKEKMLLFSRLRKKWLILLLLSLSLLIISCNGGGSSDGDGGLEGSGGLEGNDFVRLSINGAAENTYIEAFSPTIVCDPRVDWASNQVVLYDTYLGNSEWDIFFDIMFIDDAVGTYDVLVPGDGVNVVFMDSSEIYQANFATAGSSGTVTVTRSDTRIEGTFFINAADIDSNTITLSGSFGVDSGNSLSCP